MAARCFFLCVCFFLQTNSLLKNQNCFIDLTFTELEQVQIKRFFEKKIQRQFTKVTLIFLVSFLRAIFAAYNEAEPRLWKPQISLVKEALFDTV